MYIYIVYPIMAKPTPVKIIITGGLLNYGGEGVYIYAPSCLIINFLSPSNKSHLMFIMYDESRVDSQCWAHSARFRNLIRCRKDLQGVGGVAIYQIDWSISLIRGGSRILCQGGQNSARGRSGGNHFKSPASPGQCLRKLTGFLYY